jgi:spermidine/putrescine transport system ATP-binding protein
LKGSSIKIENLNKIYYEDDFVALDDVNLEIKSGEIFSLLGPSGCGKTTLLRMIGGFLEPTNGHIYMDGEDLLKLPPNKRKVNTIFQNYALFPHLNVYENIAFPLRLKKMNEKDIDFAVKKYLDLVKLNEHINKKPNQLSGGQKQRVAIARALVNEPKILLLDEPLSALDAQLRQHMLLELDAIHDEVGITFIFVTHDQQEALSVSDRIAVMNNGKVQQIGTSYEIYEMPSNSFVANFIGETNFFTGIVKDINGNCAEIEVKDLGNLKVYLDKKININEKVRVTIRPEKIRITKEKPLSLTDDFNVLNGTVDKMIYKGFQTKYYIKINEKFTFNVQKQHAKYIIDEGIIDWYEDVYIWWDMNDGYIVEVDL